MNKDRPPGISPASFPLRDGGKACFDLHCHSLASDGALAPAAVARRAAANGVQVWSLTDHDELCGLEEAESAALELGMCFINGVEISVTWAGHTVHIVGLGFDRSHPVMVQGLEEIRRDRSERAERIGRRFAELGIEGTYAGALALAGNENLLSRTHFARYLWQAGHVATVQEAFDLYLRDEGPAQVPMKWATLEDAVSWILAAGGVAVIAHPGRYRYTPVQFDGLFSTFRDLGGTAIEVVTGSHRPEQYAQYESVARYYGFRASCGSDFHSKAESRADLGSLPPLPASLTPVWQGWF
ncbi:PHP domain-containing protein [Kerstersia sp.]|uniref:PHP domain-containing protein n=1 Tax=Kerstersia sp. TaxID=1930783 RepID=UPI003F92EADD